MYYFLSNVLFFLFNHTFYMHNLIYYCFFYLLRNLNHNLNMIY